MYPSVAILIQTLQVLLMVKVTVSVRQVRCGRFSVIIPPEGTGSVSCNSVFLLHLCRFLNQEDLMEREAMVQNP
jgi:hypothetical protein